MILGAERTLIAEYGRRMLHEGMVKGTGGNISVFAEKDKLIAITPTSRDYEATQAGNVIVMDMEGNQIEGEGRPSSEYWMHNLLYLRRSDIKAVVHTHSPNASALSCLRKDLPPIYYLAISAGPSVRCAKYARAGTRELAEHAFSAMQDRYAALLANHGVIAGSTTLDFAYYIAEQVEFAAGLYLRAKPCGDPALLTSAEVKEMMDVFDKIRGRKA